MRNRQTASAKPRAGFAYYRPHLLVVIGVSAYQTAYRPDYVKTVLNLNDKNRCVGNQIRLERTNRLDRRSGPNASRGTL